MRATAASAAVLAAAGASAQMIPGVGGMGGGDLASQALGALGKLSPQCQSTVFGLISSPIVQCLNIPATIGVFTSSFSSPNASLIEPIDRLLAIECNGAGCSNETLTGFANNITQGCSEDLSKYNISGDYIKTAVAQYPLAREVVCLRTSNYNESTSANSSSSSFEPIAITSPPYNVTNGTAFCATSLLTEVSSKVGSNLTIDFFYGLYESYQNGSIAQYASDFKPADLCDECIFAAADVLGVAYPSIGNLTLGDLGLTQTNSSTVNNAVDAYANITLSQALDGQCAAYGLTWNSNGTLPANITLGAENSTFGYSLTTENGTYTPAQSASPITKRNVANIKARWVGQI